MKKSSGIERFLTGLTMVSFLALFLVVLLQVTARFFQIISVPWAEETARLLFIFCVACSAPLAYKDGEFVLVDFLLEKTSASSRILIERAVHCILLFVFLIVFLYGIIFMQLGLRQKSPTLFIPMAIPYGAVSFSAFFFLYYILRNFIHTFSRRNQ